MNDKYPYIGKVESLSGAYSIVLVTGKNYGCVLENRLDDENEGSFITLHGESHLKNIREYLTNTYGKCESQEHADFICKLAGNYDIEVHTRYEMEPANDFFNFFTNDEGVLILGFYSEKASSINGEKLIHLPLPPNKEKSMEETKPTYTKEMWERMEPPQINSQVLIHNDEGFKLKYGEDIIGKKVTVKSSFLSGEVTILAVEFDGDCYCFNIKMVKPIPTIEDELIDFITNRAWNSKELAIALIKKFNITPKAQK